MPSGLIIDYMGEGLLANRPATPDIGGGAIGLFFATDANVFAVFANGAWQSVRLGSGSQWKDPVRAATTAAITLASGLENGDTIDGVVLATGDRVLVKNQVTASENGIYIVPASGAPTRASDADSGSELLNAAVIVSEGTVNADTFWQCTSNAPITVGSTSLTFTQISGASPYTGGVQSTPILAAAMTARTTNGAASGTIETTTNKIMLPTLDFDAAAIEYAQFMFPMPKSWNEGTVTAQFIWTAASGSGDVIWGIQGVAISNDDALDAAFGTAQEVTDTLLAANDQHTTSFTSPITIGGSPVEGDLVVFQVYRKATDALDTLNGVDAKLLAIRLNFTTNAADDS